MWWFIGSIGPSLFIGWLLTGRELRLMWLGAKWPLSTFGLIWVNFLLLGTHLAYLLRFIYIGHFEPVSTFVTPEVLKEKFINVLFVLFQTVKLHLQVASEVYLRWRLPAFF